VWGKTFAVLTYQVVKYVALSQTVNVKRRATTTKLTTNVYQVLFLLLECLYKVL